ncbi:hypothetical protein HMPREF0072_0683 [Anaerococcus lactolyticus ATCC 51172]|uniref:Uncharacterized protein n=1 Tax=Anaerococcus lactolyticus ATCC 51172 TaxID=525254 RepID=C2BEB3_9FIRM|nr:hypothetical protein HMPREF0072_0683 [Anaerococcus lactolyticus ATCC 51172]
MKKLRKLMALVIATTMMASNIAPAFASGLTHNSSQAEIVNNTNNNSLPVVPAKTDNAGDFVKKTALPKIYTLRTDYMVKRGQSDEINYQPYIASVGEKASPEEQAKVNKTIDLPNFPGYKKPQDDFTYTYDHIKDLAKGGTKSGDADTGIRYEAEKNITTHLYLTR